MFRLGFLALACLLSVVSFDMGADALIISKKHKSCAVAENKSEPSRGAACDACKKFQDNRSGHLCRRCYSNISACSAAEFSWRCDDQNKLFGIMDKQQSGLNSEYSTSPWKYESEETGDGIFENKEPEKCE